MTQLKRILDKSRLQLSEPVQKMLSQFKAYYNHNRVHSSLDRNTPAEKAGKKISNVIPIENYRWKSFAHNLYQLPMAA